MKPLSRGALTTGAVGAFLLSVAYLVLVMILLALDDVSYVEGYVCLFGGLAVVAAALTSVGFFAARRALGNAQILGGLATILGGGAGAGLLIKYVTAPFGPARVHDVLVGMIITIGGVALLSLLGGIANLGKDRRTGRHPGAVFASGWVYLAAALASGAGLACELVGKQDLFLVLGLFAALILVAALIVHAIGMLALKRTPIAPS